MAGTRKLTKAGMNNTKNCSNFTNSACHIIRVVISPKGLKTPPALEAITIFIQAILINFKSLGATLSTIAHISMAVVKLLANDEITKANKPVTQNKLRKLNPFDIIQIRKLSNTPRSSIAFI